jgi:dCMP deaminase
MNAILSAAKPLAECTLYVWPFMPCSQCASAIIQSGIRRVVTVPCENERWAESFRYTEELFREAGVELVMRES